MDNISKYTKGLLILLFCVFSSSFTLGNEAYPGENLIKNEQLLRARVESMNTIFDSKYTEEFRTRLSFILKTKAVYTESMLGRMVMYFPQIDSIFEANDIPSDLKYITYIESSLNPHARSRAGAVGMWQFMSGTAKFMGIRVNRAVDERKDPYASTHAAVRYFKHLYEIYGDWALVLQAYNSGPGRVNRAIDQAGTSDFDAIQQYLPKETREYIPKFLAAVFFFKNYKEFNIEPSWPDLDLQITTRKTIHEKVRFSDLEKLAEFKEGTLERLNPSYIHKYIPKSERGYYLVVPKRFAYVFDSLMSDIELEVEVVEEILIVSEDSLLDERIPKFLDPYYRINYRVKSGQSLRKIAQLTQTSPYHLRYWNQKSYNTILAGEYLVVYLPKNEENEERLMLIAQNNLTFLSKIEMRNIIFPIDIEEELIKIKEANIGSGYVENDILLDDKHHKNAVYLLNHVFDSK